ncbi:transposase [Microbulbifer sp. ANSA002]|uniref:transposase n=1 Tax=unclassified Microbulbifer TaxID=2619833 RepID=UPI0040428192
MILGATTASVARELGVSAQQIYNSCRQFNRLSDEQFNSLDGVDYSKQKSAEVHKLKKELHEARQEVEFLKKAAVDSIDQCNTPVGIWPIGGSLNEAHIYSRRKRVDFRRLEKGHWL